MDEVIDSHDLESIRKVFGNRSPNTDLRRGNCMLKFLKWYRELRFALCPFPLHEGDVEEHLEFLRRSGSGPSSLTGFVEALNFCEHVVGIKGVGDKVSMESKKILEMSDLNRAEKKQARVLTVREVEAMEKLLSDEDEELAERFAAGAMLFALYSRSRLSDLKKVRGYVKDVVTQNGAVNGYLEFRTRTHKTARTVARQGLSMSLVAPLWGLLTPPWGLTFIKVAQLAGWTSIGVAAR